MTPSSAASGHGCAPLFAAALPALLALLLACLIVLLSSALAVRAEAQPSATLATPEGSITATPSALAYTIGSTERTVSRDLLVAAPRRLAYQHAQHDVALLLDVAERVGATWSPPAFADSTALDSLEARVDELEAALALALENVGALVAERDQLAAQVAAMETTVAEADSLIAAAEHRAQAAESAYTAAMARAQILDSRIGSFLVNIQPLLGRLRGPVIGPAEPVDF